MGYSPCKYPTDTPVGESPPLVAAARTPHEGTPQHLLLMVDSTGTEFHNNTVFTWMSGSLNHKCLRDALRNSKAMMISSGSSGSPGCLNGLPVTTPLKTILIGSIISPRTSHIYSSKPRIF